MYIGKYKKDYIRRFYIAGNPDVQYLTEVLELEHATIRFYINEFKVIEADFPEKLQDYNFFIGKAKVKEAGPWHHNLVNALPGIVAEEEGPVLVAAKLYRKYAQLYPNEYSSPNFYKIFRRWFDEHKEELFAAKLRSKFTEQELLTLHRWRKSSDHRLWQVAVTLMTVYTYHSMSAVAERIECTYPTLLKRIRGFELYGLEGINRPGAKKPIKAERVAHIKVKMDNLIHLVRQSPKTYGIERASWNIADLAFVYTREYKETITASTVSRYLKRRGVRYRRSREVIVSTDPLFREKYAEIQHILENLNSKEKFFSIDEYGPCSVRPKGGRQLAVPGFQPVYQKVDKGKGWFICTCALELSTNQLTWFYSRSKDTSEMIRLIEVLVEQHKSEDKLYLSWDAASWHASKELITYLENINQAQYRSIHHKPVVILAPLPARAPHLNVIESVFSGMSKSVIRNSDYDTLTECKTAIDRYFLKRNLYYQNNPKRAGHKIWGKERVKPIFDKANICKTL